MKLRDLLRDVPARSIRGDLDCEISAVIADSRLASPGCLFVAVPGFRSDGADFIDAAVAKGAICVLAEPPGVAKMQSSPTCAVIELEDARAAVALVAANFFGRPGARLSLVGVTGTSGKTTTTKMIESIFDATGEAVGLIGTIEYRAGDERLSADRTTPDAVVLQDWLARMVVVGVRHAVMEVSSHALALDRTLGLTFAAAVFTNLSRDHFDFHKDFEDYFAAKRKLFDQIVAGRRNAVVNIDDQYGRRIASQLPEAVVSFGRSDDADIRPLRGFRIDVGGLHGRVATPAGEVTIDSNLLGLPNLYNWLAAIGASLAVGIPIDAIERGIRALDSVPGRFERVPSGGGPTVIVDYAHKPDALEKLLLAVRELAPGKRLVVLFGCGGDRDKGKRPLMGGIASRLADFTVLTSDNPRGERPEVILDEIERGTTTGARARITDRRQAIEQTILDASDDDVIVIAGKGHETYQVSGDQILHFDDREEAGLALKKRSEKSIPKSV